MVEAVANGCVIATETSVGIEPFTPTAPADDLARRPGRAGGRSPRRSHAAGMALDAYEVLTNWREAPSVHARRCLRPCAGTGLGPRAQRSVQGSGRRSDGGVGCPDRRRAASAGPARSHAHRLQPGDSRPPIGRCTTPIRSWRSWVRCDRSARSSADTTLRHGQADHVEHHHHACCRPGGRPGGWGRRLRHRPGCASRVSPGFASGLVVMPLLKPGHFLRVRRSSRWSPLVVAASVARRSVRPGRGAGGRS